MLDLRKPKDKARYRRSVFKRRNSNDAYSTRIIRSVFRGEKGKVASAYRKSGLKGLDKAIDDNLPAWTKAFTAIWRLAGFDGWKFCAETFTRGTRKSILDFYRKGESEDWDKYVQDYIKKEGAERIKDISDTTKNRLKDTIADGVAQEMSVNNLAKEIESKYDEFDHHRAVMIAQNETTDAFNQGSLEQAREGGVDLFMIWMTAGDDRVREDHQDMEDVEPIPLDQSWDCADGTSFPGEAVNCRCTIGYVTPPEGAKEGEAVQNAIDNAEKYGLLEGISGKDIPPMDELVASARQYTLSDARDTVTIDIGRRDAGIKIDSDVEAGIYNWVGNEMRSVVADDRNAEWLAKAFNMDTEDIARLPIEKPFSARVGITADEELAGHGGAGIRGFGMDVAPYSNEEIFKDVTKGAQNFDDTGISIYTHEWHHVIGSNSEFADDMRYAVEANFHLSTDGVYDYNSALPQYLDETVRGGIRGNESRQGALAYLLREQPDATRSVIIDYTGRPLDARTATYFDKLQAAKNPLAIKF